MSASRKLPAGWSVYLDGDKAVAVQNGRIFAQRRRGDGWVGMFGPNYALPPRSVMAAGNDLLGV